MLPLWQPPIRDLQKYAVQAILYVPKIWHEAKNKMVEVFPYCLVLTTWEIHGCYC